MKLVTYIHQGTNRLGVINDSQVIDLALAWDAYPKHTGTSTSRQGSFPDDMSALLQSDDTTWQLVGPDRPILFAKFPSSIIGPGDEITWPPEASRKVDHEAELAVIIGREGRHIPIDQAYDYVAGYTIVNDVSARDVQFSDGQWVRGKSFDTFCPMGPYLLTADEVPDPHTLRIRCWVNGELRQDSNTRELIFKVPDLLAYISKTCTLMPGDILSTGTPGGVGVFRDPQVFLKTGDLVEIEIDKLGRLRNRVG